eukprot:m.294289 g.294289  ORF g.294289 m.294289 type:complete len:837 (-) comp12965_c0_seq1:1122-3632(-)
MSLLAPSAVPGALERHHTSKEQAIELLRTHLEQDGTFLVRRHASGNLVISVVFQGNISHHLLAIKDGVYTINGRSYGRCTTLDEVISMLRGPVPNWPIALTTCIHGFPQRYPPLPDRRALQEHEFLHGSLSAQETEALLCQAEDGAFLVRVDAEARGYRVIEGLDHEVLFFRLDCTDYFPEEDATVDSRTTANGDSLKTTGFAFTTVGLHLEMGEPTADASSSPTSPPRRRKRSSLTERMSALRDMLKRQDSPKQHRRSGRKGRENVTTTVCNFPVDFPVSEAEVHAREAEDESARRTSSWQEYTACPPPNAYILSIIRGQDIQDYHLTRDRAGAPFYLNGACSGRVSLQQVIEWLSVSHPFFEALTVPIPPTPDASELLLNADNLRMQGEAEDALTFYSALVSSLESSPTTAVAELAEAYFKRAGMLLDLGKHEQAFSDWNNGISLCPDDFEANMSMGKTLMATKRFTAACEAIECAVSLAACSSESDAAAKLLQEAVALEQEYVARNTMLLLEEQEVELGLSKNLLWFLSQPCCECKVRSIPDKACYRCGCIYACANHGIELAQHEEVCMGRNDLDKRLFTLEELQYAKSYVKALDREFRLPRMRLRSSQYRPFTTWRQWAFIRLQTPKAHPLATKQYSWVLSALAHLGDQPQPCRLLHCVSKTECPDIITAAELAFLMPSCPKLEVVQVLVDASPSTSIEIDFDLPETVDNQRQHITIRREFGWKEPGDFDLAIFNTNQVDFFDELLHARKACGGALLVLFSSQSVGTIYEELLEVNLPSLTASRSLNPFSVFEEPSEPMESFGSSESDAHVAPNGMMLFTAGLRHFGRQRTW